MSRRRWLFPVLLVVLPAVAIALPQIWRWADLDPFPVRGMDMAAGIVPAVCAILLLLWFFCLSGFSAAVKGVGAAVLLLLGGAAVAAVRSVDVHGNLGPVFKFRWEANPIEQLGEGELKPIDLTIDSAHDFPRYRGANADGLVTMPAPLDTNWEKNPPKLLWRRPCGGGFAGFAVAGNVAITIEQIGGDEAVTCYDRATGQQRWAHIYAAQFKDFTGNGPRATPTIAADGLVYSLGAVGDLVCLDGRTGKPRWQTNILRDSAARVVKWGMSGSPLVVGDLVIVNAGIDPANNASQAVAAYNRHTGKREWADGEHAAGYSSPQLANFQRGRRSGEEVLLFDAGGLAGFDLKTGKELWRHPWTTYQEMNIIQPLVVGPDRVLISSELRNGAAVLEITADEKQGARQVGVVWANRHLGARFSTPVKLGEAVYGLSDGVLVCLEASTGERRWRGARYGNGQLLGVGGHLLILSERPPVNVVLVAADPRRFQEVARLPVFADKTWNTPAIAGRQLFVRNHVEMACFELPVR